MKNNLITTGFHLPYNPKLKERARELRKNMTEAEKKLWHGYLRKFSKPVLRQKPIDNYIVDFYFPEFKLVIEIDGEWHNNDESIDYDKERTSVLEGYGLRVIRFSNDEVISDFTSVCVRIEEAMKSPRPPGAPL